MNCCANTYELTLSNVKARFRNNVRLGTWSNEKARLEAMLDNSFTFSFFNNQIALQTK